ncbi:hypothetical protein [Fusobacterium necrophorum]|uniref:Uncharacterized protein n=3 Tax=Fusobacterium necrophorum TaxID=859 RepID=A0AAN3VVZ3_9FUSO|nr:hypothetical protein [Fusobacterium necrophorum]EHO18822.1 hypothetical protein HMPREF9466_02100 [Fusobacterium necrophorum subsp. funduliforme 1_1_36S]EIJ72616.1 hypothetical protein HMPREF1049_0886 [Fusobacterium necrophorum subsp. funduliforme ATCC 51357]EJU17905.1 hypothetical protein HMPREF1127_1006 [Fusobacterium necrophorum subsp. funduliforme Fnf 1007]KDE61264.1 hypothetical protein FUSO4_12060 [Fusobacterium necrophorum DJ-1]KDE63318.1 hypothetical protein FUSO3_05545 [Fusobacteriu
MRSLEQEFENDERQASVAAMLLLASYLGLGIFMLYKTIELFIS